MITYDEWNAHKGEKVFPFYIYLCDGEWFIEQMMEDVVYAISPTSEDTIHEYNGGFTFEVSVKDCFWTKEEAKAEKKRREEAK